MGEIVYKSTLLDRDSIRRAVKRIAHEIVERNGGVEGLVVVGIRRRGVPLAERIAQYIEQIEGRIRRLDANYLIFRMGWPGMEGNKVLRVIEMMGERVLPYFHQKYGRG